MSKATFAVRFGTLVHEVHQSEQSAKRQARELRQMYGKGKVRVVKAGRR